MLINDLFGNPLGKANRSTEEDRRLKRRQRNKTYQQRPAVREKEKQRLKARWQFRDREKEKQRGRVYRQANREKALQYGKVYRQANREKIRQNHKTYNKLNAEKIKNAHLNRRYGIDLRDFPVPDKCPICERKNVDFHFDHHHDSGKPRGWICRYCNVILGFAKEDIQYLLNCVAWLQRHAQN